MKKTLFIIASLLMTAYCVADDVVVGNHAKRDKNLQEQAVDPGKGYTFQSGDTIIISKDVKQYLTGEEPSEWVYYVRHIVGQVGGKRFPQGILVQGINSWVGPDGLFLVGATKQTPESVKKQDKDRTKVDQRREELRQMDKDRRKAIEQDAKRNDATVIDTDRTRPVRQPEEQNRPAIRDEKPVQQPQQEVTPAVVETEPTQETLTVEEAKPIENDITISREIDRFTIGLRGGVASMLHNTIDGANGKWKPGFDVLLDLQYAHYWQKDDQPSYGILTGLSAGYVRSGVTSEASYTIPSNGQLSYDINVKAKEYDGAVLLEVPLMFSMITNNGFFFNVGPRFQLPVFNHYKTTVDNATEKNIVALFEKEGVKVDDQIVTGRADSEKGTNQTISKFNLLLGAELGYEWRLKNNNSFGLGVYANYGLFSLYKNDAAGQILDITAPNGTSFGKVDINSITKTYTQGDGFKFGAKNGLDFFDCGIKLNYSFNFVKQ
ncbi:MAG: hypothetical protein IJ621_02410 [Paludibacteraceae bacterium]|nr:hypothetical protein [Paludibacteraceae bacterium]